MTREEIFQQAAEEDKKRLEEQQNQKGGNDFHFEEKKWAVLPEHGLALIKIVGLPWSTMPRNVIDPKLIYCVKAICDNDKFGKFVIPAKDDIKYPNHIYWRLYNLIMSYKWDNEKQVKVFLYKDQYPHIFNKVRWNDRVNQQWEEGWKADKTVIMNVIDYRDYQWHKENKHLALLSKRATTGKDGTVFYDTGVPQKLYDTIFSDVRQFYGDWSQYQLAIKRSKADPFYQAFHASKEIEKVNALDPSIKGLIKTGGMTEEELSWEPYDIDKDFAISTNKKWLTRLGNFIRQVDMIWGKTFYEDLKKQVEIEDRAAGNVTNITTEKVEKKVEKPVVQEAIPVQTTNDIPPAIQSLAPQQEAPKTRAKPAAVHTFDLMSYVKEFPSLTKWSDEDKGLVLDFDAEFPWKEEPTKKQTKGVFIFKDTKMTDLLACSTCGFPFDGRITICPKCGEKY